MPPRVFDYRTDIANLVVHPELRGRFMRLEPAPAGRLHSHDLGGEIFLVVEGQCEFIVEDETVTCGPGQLIYIEPRAKHTLHAVGDAPCVVYLSVTPHIEPTHTQYDEAGFRLPPHYGSWRAKEHGDPNPGVATGVLAERYRVAARRLADLAHANAAAVERHLEALTRAAAAGDRPALKETIDDLWPCLRDLLQHTSEIGRAWNDLAPRSMPGAARTE